MPTANLQFKRKPCHRKKLQNFIKSPSRVPPTSNKLADAWRRILREQVAYCRYREKTTMKTATSTMIWVRVGDAGEYESFDDLQEAVDYLNELHVGQIDRWQSAGVETCNYWGRDYISLYHGDTDGNLTSDLLPDERAFVEDSLVECYL
jgi:hypothetical protein